MFERLSREGRSRESKWWRDGKGERRSASPRCCEDKRASGRSREVKNPSSIVERRFQLARLSLIHDLYPHPKIHVTHIVSAKKDREGGREGRKNTPQKRKNKRKKGKRTYSISG